ncbi:MAG TPA: NosD domain-containing protein [Devosiaceae bacterium]|nr:NosD domain-containing protein [Devosiaceae bacterium]
MMIIVKRIGRPAALALALMSGLAGTSLAGTSVSASSSDPTAQVVLEIEQGVLSSEKAATPEEKLAGIEATRSRYLFLTKLADGANSPEALAAAAALKRLAAESITADILTSDVLSTVMGILAGGKVDAQTAVRYRVEIEGLVIALTSPALRASAYSWLADIDAARDPAGAIADLGRAVKDADAITEADSKNSALNAIAQTAARIKGNAALPLVNQAIAGMWPSRQRGFAWYSIARGELTGNDAKLDSGKLGAAVSTAIQQDDLPRALKLALAIDPESEGTRAKALNAVLDKALERGETGMFEPLTSAYADDSDQQDAITAMVRNRIDNNRTLDAVALASELPVGPVRARVEYLLAAALQKGGFATMANEAFQRGSSVVQQLAGGQKDAALVEAIAGAAALGKLQDGLSFFHALSDPSSASQALRKLGKALADADMIADAQAVYEKLSAADDRDYVFSAIAQAKTEDGDLQAGEAAIAQIADQQNRGRVQAEIARQYAKQSKFEQAFSTAAAIDDRTYKVQAMLRIADVALDKKQPEFVGKANDLALETAKSIKSGSDRDSMLLSVAESLAKARDLTGAQAVAAQIGDTKAKAKALGFIAKYAAKNGDAKAALSLLDQLPAVADRDEAAADALIAVSGAPAFVERAVRRAKLFPNDALRVATLRSIATEQLRRLDSLGLGTGKGASTDYTISAPHAAPAVHEAAMKVGSPVFGDGRMTMYRAEASPGALHRYGYPDLSYGVAQIRQEMPGPEAGHVGVTLANLSPYNDKFLEDLPGGDTGMSAAAKAQRLPSPRIIVIQSGVYTLGSLARELANSGSFQLVTRNKDVVTLRAPLLVGKNATLILSGEEAATYRLGADTGSFISVAGKLFIVDTRVESWDESAGAIRRSNPHTREVYRPFIIGWSGSHLYVGGSVLDSLGYAAPKSFGLGFSTGPTSVIAEQPDLPPPTGRIVDNVIDNFEYGFYSYEAEDVLVAGNEYRDNVVYGVDPHDRSKRLVLALNTMHNTQYKHGMIISRQVDGSWMIGNVSFDNAGSGFMLDRDSSDTLIYGNVAFGNHGDGLTFFESPCNLAVDNHFFGNDRDGVKLRNSWNVGVFGNELADNGGTGINGYTSHIEEISPRRNFVEDPYTEFATFTAGNNRISGNSVGVKLSGVAAASLFDQDFHGQRGPLLSGDGRPFEGAMLRFDRTGGTVVVGQACGLPRPVEYCGFSAHGILGDNGQAMALTPAEQTGCGGMAKSSALLLQVSGG